MESRKCVTLCAHLPQQSRDFLLETADVFVAWGGALFLSHSQVLGLESPHIASLISLSREQVEPQATAAWLSGRLPVVSVLPATPLAVPDGLAKATAEQFGAFLALVYRRQDAFEWTTISEVLELADYFGAGSVIARADAWLCEQCRRQEPTASSRAFQLAARFRLGGAMALLLPWAVQCMARGSRCSAVWYDGKQLCTRLKLAFEDCQLKCLALDAYWWSRGAQGVCPTCACRPSDIAASWETRQEWAVPHYAHLGGAGGGTGGGVPGAAAFHPGVYDRAVRHYSHLLQEASWGCTPAGVGVAAAAAAARGD